MHELSVVQSSLFSQATAIGGMTGRGGGLSTCGSTGWLMTGCPKGDGVDVVGPIPAMTGSLGGITEGPATGD